MIELCKTYMLANNMLETGSILCVVHIVVIVDLTFFTMYEIQNVIVVLDILHT